MISVRKADGKISRTQAWNMGWMFATAAFAIGVELLPQLDNLMSTQAWLAVAFAVKSGDMFFRTITSQPMR